MNSDESETTVPGDDGVTALTLDNTLLSRPTIEPSTPQQAMVVRPLAPPRTLYRASNCTSPPASGVEAYVEAGIAPQGQSPQTKKPASQRMQTDIPPGV